MSTLAGQAPMQHEALIDKGFVLVKEGVIDKLQNQLLTGEKKF